MSRKTLKGEVISTKMQNTVVVKVERKFRHKLYKKVLKKHKNYHVDTNGFSLKEGDKVLIEETRPLSKTKHFRVIKVMKEEK